MKNVGNTIHPSLGWSFTPLKIWSLKTSQMTNSEGDQQISWSSDDLHCQKVTKLPVQITQQFYISLFPTLGY